MAVGDGLLIGFEFVDLLDVNSETTSCIETTWTLIALEMLGLLVLHQYCDRLAWVGWRSSVITLLVFELSLAIPTPWSQLLVRA
jgi:hypothetical protein